MRNFLWKLDKEISAFFNQKNLWEKWVIKALDKIWESIWQLKADFRPLNDKNPSKDKNYIPVNKYQLIW